tara:strand:+ start:464 stop:817 length:354 start_codon:yes stop_codon:yes gene_type:complete
MEINMRKKKSITQMPGSSKRQRADTNLTRAQENRLAREAEEARKEKLKEERNKRNPPTAVERGLKRGMQNLKKAVGLKDGGKVKKMAYGGKVKKMGAGGGMCRGMGAATQGGNYKAE